MLSAIPELDRRGLRSFGLATGLTVGALFGLALPWLLEHDVPIWPRLCENGLILTDTP
jgi:hypothetical protein